MLELIEGLPSNVVGIVVKGRVTKQECCDILTPAVAKSLRWREKIRLYYELSSRFPGAGWEDLELGIEYAARCERTAIVTDIGWVGLTVKAIRFLIPGEIRVFATIQAPEGLAWITARPGSRADHLEPVRTYPTPPRPMRRPPSRRVLPSAARQLQTESSHRHVG